MSKKPEELITLYHYTDEESAKKIKESGNIKESKDTTRDAIRGHGVYTTALSPIESNKTLVKNNYDDGIGMSQNKKDKFDVAFEIQVPKDKIKKVETKDGRDIYVHKGDISTEYVKKTHYRNKPDVPDKKKPDVPDKKK